MPNETRDRRDRQENGQDQPEAAPRPEAKRQEEAQASSGGAAAATDEAEAARAEASDAEAETADADEEAAQGEVDILRAELMTLQAQLEAAKKESADYKDKFLRARADLENYRRRAAQDVDRAREAGVDSAVLAVLPAYDDLGRALLAAETDPAKIVPGVEAVREGLKRNLEALGIKEVGKQGDTFDPDFHEALTSVPTDDKAMAGKVAEVFQVGFTKGERLVRPARVVVYQD